MVIVIGGALFVQKANGHLSVDGRPIGQSMRGSSGKSLVKKSYTTWGLLEEVERLWNSYL